jgi:mRNA interferase MazF
MRLGKMPKPGDVILASVQFTDTDDVKVRPAVVLFEELENVVIAGVTSNLKMKGIPLTKKEGAVKDSVIKLNYIFTISNEMASKVLFHLSKEKKRLIFNELTKRLEELKTN